MTLNYVLVANKLSNVGHQNLELEVIVWCVAVAVFAFFDHQADRAQFLAYLLDFQQVVDKAYPELLLSHPNPMASQALAPSKVQVQVS